MNTDKFQLGNFDGLEDIDNLQQNEPAAAGESGPPPARGQAPQTPARGQTPQTAITQHPTEKNHEQPKFDWVELVSIDLIVPNEFQPRRIFNAEKLQELAQSIKEHGIIQPLVLTPREDGRYEMVVGERRFRAAKLAGLSSVPAFVKKDINSRTKLELALIENVQRADLNPIEEAKAYERLRAEFGLPVNEIARRVGKNASTVSNLMRLLKLPAEVQRALTEEVINEGQARPLLSLESTEEVLQMLRIIVRNEMKVRDVENKVREIKKRGIKVREMFTADPFLESLENLLRNKLGTRVRVNRSAKGGKITIEFYSDDELNNIVEKLA